MNESSLKLFKTKPLRLVDEDMEKKLNTRIRQLIDAGALSSHPGGLKKRNKTNK